MFSWIKDIWDFISQIVQAAGSTMDDLVTRIDNVQFNEDFIISKFLGTIHYIVGSPLYEMFTGLIIIGAGLLLWKLVKIVINAISGLVPGLKGRVKVE